MTVLVRDIQHYEQLLHSTLFRLPGVAHMRTNIVLKEVKFDMRLPVEALPLAAAAPRSGSAEPEASG